ncbi:hypothetical protein G9A89_017127 [Geosiphon pyriformis]|nr:hypothetical protein G9A89_017127 [Geosiphon pyriformis]
MAIILKDLNCDFQCHQDSDHCHLNQILKLQQIPNNPNSELINQENLPLEIVINQQPINLIAEQIQQPPILPQSLFLQLLHQSNIDPIAYILIVKLKKFMNKKDNTQPSQPTDRMMSGHFKPSFISYKIPPTHTNTFTTIIQRETEAVTTYLRHFYRNLCQIQAIQANYFTAPQILNQFICGLHSSILQCICLMHPQTLQNAVTNAKDFEFAKLEANHAQAVSLVINKSSELDSKLKQFKSIAFIIFDQSTISNSKLSIKPRTISTKLPTYNATANLSNTNLSADNTSNLLTATPTYLSTTASSNISIPTNFNTTSSDNIRKSQIKDHPKLAISNGCPPTNSQLFKPWSLGTEYTQNLSSQNYLSLLVTPEDATLHNLETKQKQSLTNNILPATITKDKSLTAIFFFEFKEPIKMPLFSRTTLESKPITVIYTDAKVNGQHIKLILNSELTDSIIT